MYLDIYGAGLVANNHVLDVGWDKDVLHCHESRNDKDEAFTFQVYLQEGFYRFTAVCKHYSFND